MRDKVSKPTVSSAYLKHFRAFSVALLLTCIFADANAQELANKVEDSSSDTLEQARFDALDEDFDSSDEQGQVPLDESFGEASSEEILEQRKKPLKDTKLEAELRTFYLHRDRFDSTQSEALGLGGLIGFKTGYFRERLAFGATGFTSQRLYGPEGKGGTNLLAPIQQGYCVLGEIYGEYIFTDSIKLDFGRKRFNNSFINESDDRMTPYTFQAAALLGNLGGENGSSEWRFGAGYFDKIKDKTSEKFISMSTKAGALDGVERGVYVAGVNVSKVLSSGKLSFGAINYYSTDIINIFYTEATYTIPATDNVDLKLAMQYIAQDSTGDNLLFGVPFSADQVGIKAELSIGDALFTTSWNRNSDSDALQSPWGDIPSYNSSQVQDFNLAGVDSLRLRAQYTFKAVPGLSAYALWVNGSRPNDPAESAQDEYDYNLQWDTTQGSLKGFSLRLRYAVITQDIGGPDLKDFRFIVNYSPSWL